MRTIGGRTAAIVAAALLGLTAACTDDSPPPPTPTTSSSTPTSPTPTTSPTPQPESAEAFIRRWAEANTEMQNSGDTSEFMSLTQGCTPCRRLRDIVRDYYSAGGFIRADGWSIRSITKAPSGDRSRPVFTVDVVSGKTKLRRAAGERLTILNGGPARFRFTLVRHSNTWLVVDYIEVQL
jgi:hypothetical protein